MAGLRYDITDINRCCDQSSEHVHQDVTSVIGKVPIRSASLNQCGMCKNCKCNSNFVVLLLLENGNILVEKFVFVKEHPHPQRHQKLHPLQNVCGCAFRLHMASAHLCF